MPALASHRKPRSRTLPVLHSSSPAAVGVTTAAALASVAFISSQSATAAPAPPTGRTPTAGAPSPEEVSAKVDDLYRQAGSGDTGRTAAARSGVTAVGTAPAERPTERTSDRVADLIDAPPPRAEDRLPDAWMETVRTEAVRSEAGCEEEDRTGGVAVETAPRVVKERSQSRLAQARLLLVRAAAERTPATGIPTTGIPVEPRSTAIPAAARHLSVVPPRPTAPPRPVLPPSLVTTPVTAPSADATGSLSTEAARVVAFAEAQLGKPYVPGAAGPSSYDCSGLVRAAWKAAGVELPRDAGAQALAGTPVAMGQMRAGDLVFFHGGGSGEGGHVGIYKGDGMMIHAPGPGAGVREESVFSMPIHGSVRPA
ncbi:NlpC/P60 family protein [Streptomyces sp. NPDC046887]|uniref:C40 family peptidase n=1 Tax=Streptomyces sp. NPDC046887 TaxID=3155472 RepID=UPI0033F79434